MNELAIFETNNMAEYRKLGIRASPSKLVLLRQFSTFAIKHWIFLLMLISTSLFFLAGYVNQVPWWDDKAYLNNALLHSGRVREADLVGPFADERPPLFWWILTTLFAYGFPMVSAKFVSPFFGVVLVVVTGLFARKLFKSNTIGFLSGLFLTSNAFFMLMAGMILTDVPGTLLSTLFLFCLYLGMEEKRNEYLLVSGILLALSLMMREQNLIFIPIAIFYCISRARILDKWNTLLALFCSILPGLPVFVFGLLPFLIEASNFMMPLVAQPFAIPFTSVAVSQYALILFIVSILVIPMALDNLRTKRIKFDTAFSIFAGIVLFALIIYPYLWDNYTLGATFQIQGKGVLSRWISHEIQSETIGQGVDLTPWGRRFWWLSHLPALISLPILLYSLLGLKQLVKSRMSTQLEVLLPWIAYTTGFTIFFSYIEARYFIPALPPLAILSAVGLVKLIRYLGSGSSGVSEHSDRLFCIKAGIVALSVLVTNVLQTDLVLPTQVGSVTVLDLARRAYYGYADWYSSYSIALSAKLMPPNLHLDPSYVFESLLCLAIVILLPLCILKTDSSAIN
ncbi:MAG TPA: glycosyltransferase family 39 protein [Candidatus Bathyarchaeia archaeon]|nr:glycosyltransferase family 39 protein [Candidatus Bathyarchaeia archaeon]